MVRVCTPGIVPRVITRCHLRRKVSASSLQSWGLLNEIGYPSNSNEDSISRSMSGPPPGPMLPSSILPSSTYGDFRDAGREVARQRRRNVEHSRRQEKMRMRRAAALLPSIQDPGSSQALDVSGSIDSLAAHSNSSYPHGSRSEYSSISSMQEPYSGTIPR